MDELTQKKNVDNLRAFSRDASVKLLNSHSQRVDFKIEELNSDAIVFGHWMAMILVSGRDLKITFKVHFMTKAAQRLAAPVYSLKPEEISVDQAVDFVREYCNLMGGSLKKNLMTQKIDTGISLPVVTRGFDEVFFARTKTPNMILDLWNLRSKICDLKCSLVADFINPIDLTQLPKVLDLDAADQGDVEFL